MSGLFRLLKDASGLAMMTLLMAVVSGAFNAGLIVVAHRALTASSSELGDLLFAFIGVGVGKLLTGFLAEVILVRYSERTVAEIRRRLIRSALEVPLAKLEKIGSARVYGALTDDVASVHAVVGYLPSLVLNLSILAAGGVYLLWLSWQGVVALAAMVVLGALAHRRISHSAYRSLQEAREARDRLYAHFRALVDGNKELKLHGKRRAGFLSSLVDPTTVIVEKYGVEATTRFTLAHSVTHVFFFALIGVVLFALPAMQESSEVVSGYVLTCLYLLGPLTGTLRAGPLLSGGRIALAKIDSLGLALDPGSQNVDVEIPAFERLEFHGVTFEYDANEDDRRFAVGPIDLCVEPGKLTFVTGGNGSGKSTLAKLLAGLYEPSGGEIHLNGQRLAPGDSCKLKEQVSAVFTDFFLFTELLGLETHRLDENATTYLDELDLGEKVTVTEGTLSTTRLSQGQEKRLALLTAFLEDRPFYLFDEWAADQDPEFREVFYREILPELKRRNKAIVAITHDDRYFDMADERIKLESGCVVRKEEA